MPCFGNLQCDCVSTIPFDVWDAGKQAGDIGKDHNLWCISLLKARHLAKFLKSRVRTRTQAIGLKIRSFKSHTMHEHLIPRLKIVALSLPSHGL